MATATSRIVEGLPRIAELTRLGLERAAFTERMLAVLLEMGFERARYYEAAKDVVRRADPNAGARDDGTSVSVKELPGEQVLVLTAQLPDQTKVPVGMRVPLKESTLERKGGGLRPIVGRPEPDGESNPSWVDLLDLTEKSWVEIPIMEGGDLVGLIGADWQDQEMELDGRDLDALNVLGTAVGAYLGLKPIMLLDRYRSLSLGTADEPPHKVASIAAEQIGNLLDVAATAVFAFEWPHQRLRKIDEYVAPGLVQRARRLGRLEECYEVGEHLTGRAWREPALRYIVDFDSLKRFGEDLVAQESLDWHSSLFEAEIESVMYAVLGSLDRRYLLRFMNRGSRPELPFLGEHIVLDALLTDLRSDVDATVANQRSRSLEEIARLTASITDPSKLVKEVATSLKAENVEHFAVVCHQKGAAQFGFSVFCGDRLQGSSFARAGEWAADSMYVAAVEAGQDWRRVADFTHDGRGSLGDLFRRAEFRGVLTLPMETGQTQGALFVPVDSLPGGGRRRELPDGCTFGTVSLLLAYSRLIGNAVETRNSAARADGARRALGFLGHELRAPLAELGSAAESSIVTAKTAVREVSDMEQRTRLITQLNKRAEALYDRQREVSIALGLSPIIAQESEGNLQLHLSRANLSELVRRAIREVQTELHLDRDQRSYEFRMAPSAARLETIVCDRDYIRHVLKNIIRNAVNYSLPRRRGEPMVIDLIGERQQRWLGVKVRNWGLGIPPERRDLIFEAWVRGGVADRLKAVRGMGLGLFLARRIMAAHDGAILFESHPTLDDPRRTEQLEGFETVFEVRIPRDLPEGTYTHHWGPAGGGNSTT